MEGILWNLLYLRKWFQDRCVYSVSVIGMGVDGKRKHSRFLFFVFNLVFYSSG